MNEGMVGETSGSMAPIYLNIKLIYSTPAPLLRSLNPACQDTAVSAARKIYVPVEDNHDSNLFEVMIRPRK